MSGFNYQSPLANQFRVVCGTTQNLAFQIPHCFIEAQYDEFLSLIRYDTLDTDRALTDLEGLAKAVDDQFAHHLKEEPVLPTTSPLSPATSPLLTSTSRPTVTPILTATPTPWPTSTSTSVPTVAPTPAGIAPPAGLIYKTVEGLWRVSSDGKPVRLFEYSFGATVSPDGLAVLYPQEVPSRDALWLIDLNTGQRRNVTKNIDRTVCCPVWWPSRPAWVLFGSWPPGSEAPDTGYLTAARLDGTEHRILDTASESNALPAPSPDGRTIAYDRSGSAWLYNWDTGPKHFDPAEYGVSDILRIASPAWSPDGDRLAWYIGGDFGQGWQVGLAVFDLETKTGRLLHVYTNVGHGGWFDAPAWSPDGRWLAFNAEDQDQAQAGLWITQVDGQEEHLSTRNGMHVYGLPVWRSDSRWLAAGRMLYEINTKQSWLLNLPSDAEVVAWIKSAPQ